MTSQPYALYMGTYVRMCVWYCRVHVVHSMLLCSGPVVHIPFSDE